MQDYDKDFKDYIETLPPELKQAIYSVDYAKQLQEIVKNNKLMIDQAGKLEAETTLVIAGIEPLNKYVNNLSENVGLSKIQASIVAHDVNELIFKNIREALKKINEKLIEEEKTIETATAPTKDAVLAGIEHPEDIKNTETSVSISSQKSNGANPETHEAIDTGVEIRVDNLPEVALAPQLPAISSLISKSTEPFHQNISPIQNILKTKLTETVVVPKENIVIEEKTKLPNKLQPTASQPIAEKSSGDPYREPIK